jgi:3-dehydroquinate dehydratase
MKPAFFIPTIKVFFSNIHIRETYCYPRLLQLLH